MARDYIKLDRTAVQSGSLLQLVYALRNAYEQCVKVKAVMDHNNDGTSFTDIETLFGVPTGKGQTVYNFVNGSIGTMTGVFQTSDVKNLTETVG
jgi:hypothetical protein